MSWLRFFGRRPRPEPEKPLRAELLSIERLEERARALAASFTLARNPRPKSRTKLSKVCWVVLGSALAGTLTRTMVS